MSFTGIDLLRIENERLAEYWLNSDMHVLLAQLQVGGRPELTVIERGTVRITVFGASGKVGRLVVWEILRRGHQVQAFVHSRNPFEGQEEVTVIKGEVADTAAVHAAQADSDAAITGRL